MEDRTNINGKRINVSKQETGVKRTILEIMKENTTNAVVLKSKSLTTNEKIKLALEETKEIMMANTPKMAVTFKDFYGLPEIVKDLLEKNQGITELYEWQDECLRSPSILNRQNMILCLPTSGGKTLIAQILILKELLCYGQDAILVLPFISIVHEKVREMSPLAIVLNFNVEEYASSKGSFPPKRKRKRNTIYIATIEKAHSLINSLIENDRLMEIGLIVVDELHMVGEDGHRGATLESMLTKIMFLGNGIQIIGMSATLGNSKDVQKFLNADVYEGNFRPVVLKEFIKIDDNIMEINPNPVDVEEKFKFIRKFVFKSPKNTKTTDPDQIAGLVLEVVPDNSCLVFCSTRKNTENVASLICNGMPDSIKDHKSVEKKALLDAICSDENGSICKILKFTIPYGVAYHHGGLTMDERRHLEEAYSNGTLCCLTCTSTLAAGVNLPAKRVILRSPYIGREFLSVSKYKQMVGRAGRTGIDTSGESVVIIQSRDRSKVYSELFNMKNENVITSSLFSNEKGLKSLILSLVGLKITKTINDIDRFLSMTLLFTQKDNFDIDILKIRTDAIKDLINISLLKATYDANNRHIEHAILSATDLGHAAFKGSINVDVVNRLYEDLTNGLNGLVLHNHLHLLYLITSYEAVQTICFRSDIFKDKYLKLSSEDAAVASSIGITISHITQMACGKTTNIQTVQRFYVSLILNDLWHGKSIWEVASDFEVHRGTVQQLLTTSIGFASCVLHFCQELPQFWSYSALLEEFVKQFSYCVTAELVPLMELPSVKRARASLLYKNGYKTIQDVANADVSELVSVISYMPRKVAREIIASAQMLIIEKANDLQAQAEELVEGLHT